MDNISLYYDRIVPGGIAAGTGTTLLDHVDIGGCWMHTKPDRRVFRYSPIIITLDRSQRAHDEMAKWGIQYAFKRGIRHSEGWRGLSQAYMEDDVKK